MWFDRFRLFKDRLFMLGKDSKVLSIGVLCASIAFILICSLHIYSNNIASIPDDLDDEDSSTADEDVAFKPTKFGPIRQDQTPQTRYHILAYWRAAEHSLETCMDAINEIYPNLQDNKCDNIELAFQKLLGSKFSIILIIVFYLIP
jgi:hypothetical protein